MCGIVGILHFSSAPVEKDTVRKMCASMVHRGPDDEGIYIADGIGLGHRRLSVIDLVSGHQPLANREKTIWITYNGEIYNYVELRRRLIGLGHQFVTESDTEVIVHAYEQFGEECPKYLKGMFAFAIWDSRRQRFFLARDRIGKKPLFYHHGRGIFAFASEVKALLCHPELPCEILPSALPHYFTFGYAPSPHTYYRGILELPPAHTLTVEVSGRIDLRRYWDLDFFPRMGRGPTVEEAAREIRELLAEAVRKRLVADVPLGVFLSGGIDSTIVVGLMRQLMQRPVKTFSIGFAGDKTFDETSYSRLVASHFRTDHTEFIVEPKAIDLIEPLVWYHDGPFGDSSAIPTYILAQLTRDHVTVALNGDGGDELFAGYLRFYATILAERIPKLLLQLGKKTISLLPEPTNYHHWLRRAQRFLHCASYPFFDRFSNWISLFNDDLPLLLRPEVFSDLSSTGISYHSEVVDRTVSFTPLSKLLYLNVRTYLYQDLLVKMDRTTMAHGLEARSPFLDQDLMEYTAALPDHMKLMRGVTKYILRRAFSDLIPKKILTRGKRGFGVPLGAWFRGELRDYLHDLLLASDSKLKDYLNNAYVRQIVQEHMQGKRDHGQRLWAILTFEVWLRTLQQWSVVSEAPVLSSQSFKTLGALRE